MADVTVNTYELKLVLTFADEDTRTLTLSDPAASIATADSVAAAAINDLSDYLFQNQVFVGDKSGAAFNRIGSAKIIDKNLTYLDI